jgi:hypothetical protein
MRCISKILDIGRGSIYTLNDIYFIDNAGCQHIYEWCQYIEIMENDREHKKKLDKDIVHYYNFLIKKLYPLKGGEEKPTRSR